MQTLFSSVSPRHFFQLIQSEDPVASEMENQEISIVFTSWRFQNQGPKREEIDLAMILAGLGVA